MSTERVPLWLDCDPGHDDTFAILLAAYHPQIELLGISTVHGNASLDKTTNNALSVLTAIGKEKEITVYPGAAKALYRPPIHAPTDIHGESGLDGTTLLPKPAATADTSTSAVDAMAAALRAQPAGKAWLIATGAVTNVGALILAHPDLAEHVAGVSIMGGAIGNKFTAAPLGVVDGVERIGNWTPWAEFNILIDPEAAQVVFGNPVLAAKTTLIPLDLTHLVLATQEVQADLLYGADAAGEKKATEDIAEAYKTTGIKGKTDLRTMLVELLNFFAGTYRDVFGIIEGPPLHDPLAVAIALIGTASEIPFYDFDPASPEGPQRRERFDLAVVTEGTLAEAQAKDSKVQTGRTVAKLLEPGKPGVRIPRGLDIPLFWKVIEECCQRADEANAARAAGRQ
ncbi:inosine-uridine preferring nucleoside hydrolase [Microdochium trichocladiopsis]|uniref:Inosine-uridine preferring nucleoside hydrolase n=1 Tax=Microdochium trichocladiopsis TaxID=1682393 RepID=A0A9P9BSS9_9PEZI|nr:inosine-uridine preferring nucleoside hydrolase [Microdochium trichocladiopsis]KAH7035160.1 inosine-uridine preferring nucleoside hydrolase [Microdochium trichocladiopsis]